MQPQPWEGETASSLREQMSMLGQKGLETSGCGGNNTNLGVCSSCRETERPQERARIKQAVFWGDENYVAGPRGGKGRACLQLRKPLNCLPRRKTQWAGRQLMVEISSVFSACFEFTQRMFIAIIRNVIINIVTNRSFGLFMELLFRGDVGRSTPRFQSIQSAATGTYHAVNGW